MARKVCLHSSCVLCSPKRGRGGTQTLGTRTTMYVPREVAVASLPHCSSVVTEAMLEESTLADLIEIAKPWGMKRRVVGFGYKCMRCRVGVEEFSGFPALVAAVDVDAAVAVAVAVALDPPLSPSLELTPLPRLSSSPPPCKDEISSPCRLSRLARSLINPTSRAGISSVFMQYNIACSVNKTATVNAR